MKEIAQHARARVFDQAFAAWQWWNHYLAQAPAGRRVLRINWDDTAVCLFEGGGRGNVFFAKTEQAVVQNASRAKQRTFLTHVAFICDDPLIQAALPQIVIANTRTIPGRMLAALEATCPPQFRLLTGATAWVTARVCAQIVRWLAAALAQFAADVQPVLLLDARRQHLSNGVFAACSATRIWPLVVPAKMTWLLQPLNTHAFFSYKTRLRICYHAACIASDVGSVDVAGLLQCIYDATRAVLTGGAWAAAFDGNGFGLDGQTRVRARVARALASNGPVVVAPTRPTLGQLRACFPRNVRVNEAVVWRPLAPPVHVAAPRGPGDAVALRTVFWSAPPPHLPSVRGAALWFAPPPPLPSLSGAASSSSSPPAGAAAPSSAGPSGERRPDGAVAETRLGGSSGVGSGAGDSRTRAGSSCRG